MKEVAFTSTNIYKSLVNDVSHINANNSVPNENSIDVGVLKKLGMIVVCHNSSEKLTLKSISTHSYKTTNAARQIIRNKLESVKTKIEKEELSYNQIKNTQHLKKLDKKLLQKLKSQEKYDHFLDILNEYEKEFNGVNPAATTAYYNQ